MISDSWTVDPKLEDALSALDDALLAGQSADELERRVAEVGGPDAGELLSTIRSLHDISSSPGDRLGATAHSVEVAAGGGASLVGFDRSYSHFGRFEILERIGAGGGGVVYRAFDPQLGRAVALKVPHAELLSLPDSRQRFIREARLVAALQHPNIVPVFDAGEINGTPYIVQEYSPGPDLAEWIRLQSARGAVVPYTLAAEWMYEIADALARVHACGIVHRDLKPGNVLLEPKSTVSGDATAIDAAHGLRPRVTDFGISKLCNVDEKLTATHAVLGTTQYMAPEQAAGAARDVGPASDVYSLGVILYELLTGACPFQSNNSLALLRSVVEDDPVPAKRARRDVPTDLSSICMKCLEKEPARRYATAAELRDDLRRYLDHLPVVARPASAAHRLARWCKRRPAHAALAAVSSLAIVVVAAGGWWYSGQVEDALAKTEDARQAAIESGQAAERNARELEVALRETEAARMTAIVAQQAAELNARDLGIALKETEAARKSAIDAQFVAERSRRDMALQLFPNRIRTAHQYASAGDVKSAAAVMRDKAIDEGDPRRESFAVRYVDGLCEWPERVITPGHGEIYAVRYAPDGKTLAVGSLDGCVTLWEPATGRLLGTLRGHSSCVNAIEYLPDGKRIVTASCDHTVRLWNSESQLQESLVLNAAGPVFAIAISKDGARAATGEQSGLVRMWDTANWREVAHALVHEPAKVDALQFLSDGKTLVAAAGQNPGLHVLTHVGGETLKVATPKFVAGPVPCLAVSPSEDTIVYCAVKDRLAVADLGSFEHIATFGESGSGGKHGIAFSRDGRLMAAAGHERVVRVWDVATRQLRTTFVGHSDRIFSLTFSPDDQSIASAGVDGSVRIWSLAKRAGWRTIPVSQQYGKLEFTPDQRFLVAQNIDTVAIYDTRDWQEVRRIPGFRFALGAAATPETYLLAVGSKAGIEFWNLPESKQCGLLAETVAKIRALELAPRAPVLLTAFDDLPGTLWDLEFGMDTPQPVAARARYRLPVEDVPDTLALFSADASQAVTPRGETLELARWKTDSTALLPVSTDAALSPSERRMQPNPDVRFDVHFGGITAIALSPDSRFVASTSYDRMLHLTSLDDPSATTAMAGHSQNISSIAFFPDGQTIATGGSDHTIKLWEVATGQELLTLEGHQSPLCGVAFSPDGTLLASGSVDEGANGRPGMIIIWYAPRSNAAQPAEPGVSSAAK